MLHLPELGSNPARTPLAEFKPPPGSIQDLANVIEALRRFHKGNVAANRGYTSASSILTLLRNKVSVANVRSRGLYSAFWVVIVEAGHCPDFLCSEPGCTLSKRKSTHFTLKEENNAAFIGSVRSTAPVDRSVAHARGENEIDLIDQTGTVLFRNRIITRRQKVEIGRAVGTRPTNIRSSTR